MSDEQMRRFIQAARRATDASSELQELWREIPEDAFLGVQEREVSELLWKLIYYRISPAAAFGALRKCDMSRARDALIRFYVGKGLNPDRKYGGYVFELDTMIGDLFEEGGETALRLLVNDAQFDPEKFSDPRVIGVFAEVLDIEPAEVLPWYQRVVTSAEAQPPT